MTLMRFIQGLASSVVSVLLVAGILSAQSLPSGGIVTTGGGGGAPSGPAGGDLAGTYPNPTIKSSVSLATPNVNVATGTSLALNGATLGTNKLAVSGTTLLGGNVSFSGGTQSTYPVGGGSQYTLTTDGGFTIIGGGGDSSIQAQSNLAVNAGVGSVILQSNGSAWYLYQDQISAPATGKFQSGAPAGSTAKPWMFGNIQTGAVVLDTTRSVFVNIDGTVYKLMVAQ